MSVERGKADAPLASTNFRCRENSGHVLESRHFRFGPFSDLAAYLLFVRFLGQCGRLS
jgi:hypothetical protein